MRVAKRTAMAVMAMQTILSTFCPAEEVNILTTPATQAVPTGTVIMWWGARGGWPDNYALCDGTPTNINGMVIRKPDLIGRFPRGAAEAATAPSNLLTGGRSTLDLKHDHQVSLPHHHDAGALAAAIIYRGADAEKFWVKYAAQTFKADHYWHFGSCCDEGMNIVAENHTEEVATAVFGTTADANPGATTTSALTDGVEILPLYQDLFFLIKVR